MNSPGKRNSTFVSGSLHTKLLQAAMQEPGYPAGSNVLSAALLRAAMIGELSVVKVLLDRGVDVNSPDQQGRTALMEAAFGNHCDVVNLLIDRGADINATDRDGWTALMEASSKGFYDIVKVLMSKGADPKSKNKNGWTALKSVASGHFKLARLLRDAGATE